MSESDEKTPVSFIKEIFSFKTMKRDFVSFLKMRKEDSFIFWGMFALIAVNCLVLISIFFSYIIIAVHRL